MRTGSLSWAESVRIALAAEGIESVVLDQGAFGSHGILSQVRLAVIDDYQLARAQAVLAKLRAAPAAGTPLSWRWQKRGLLVLGLGLVLLMVSGSLLDREEPLPRAVVYGAFAVTALTFALGFVLIALGPRADKGSTERNGQWKDAS